MSPSPEEKRATYMKLIDSTIDDMGKRPFDFFSFIPGDPQGKTVALEQFEYTEKGEPVLTSIGPVYHVMLFDIKKANYAESTEYFEAVLVDPIGYVKRMVKDGWFGIVARKTSTSDKVEAHMKKHMLPEGEAK